MSFICMKANGKDQWFNTDHIIGFAAIDDEYTQIVTVSGERFHVNDNPDAIALKIRMQNRKDKNGDK